MKNFIIHFKTLKRINKLKKVERLLQEILLQVDSDLDLNYFQRNIINIKLLEALILVNEMIALLALIGQDLTAN